jgi:putative transposase
VADTFAYCLLRNHFHFLVRIKTVEEQQQTLGDPETPKVCNPSQQFGNLFNAYAKAINKAYERTGSLFEKPFGRVPVTSGAQFACLVTYIHRNPQKHGLVSDFRDWPYSSYHAFLSQKASRLKREEVLAWFDGPHGFEAQHARFAPEGVIAPLIAEDFD